MSSIALAPTAASRPAINPWFVAAAVVVPTFMEVLDTTIANVALRYIAGGLSVVPYVYYKERPGGPHAGEMLQPLRDLPQGPVVSISGEASPSNFPVPKGPSGP